MLWHPPGEELPSELLASLGRRIGRMSVCTEAYTAAATVFTLERERRQMPPEERAPTALVLIEPARLTDARQVIEAVRLLAPKAVCWWFSREANPRLQSVVDDHMDAWERKASEHDEQDEPEAHAPASAASSASPTTAPRGLRLVGTQDPEHDAREDERLRQGSMLTEDELRLLLGTDSGPAGQHGGLP